jgi:hypothetical protein
MFQNLENNIKSQFELSKRFGESDEDMTIQIIIDYVIHNYPIINEYSFLLPHGNPELWNFIKENHHWVSDFICNHLAGFEFQLHFNENQFYFEDDKWAYDKLTKANSLLENFDKN